MNEFFEDFMIFPLMIKGHGEEGKDFFNQILCLNLSKMDHFLILSNLF